MRIVAGRYKGRTIVAPKGRTTRPTSDRVREGLFSALSSRLGADLGGEAVLDAFAGSGALGLEALSRGVSQATFLDKDRDAVLALRANVAALGADERVSVIPADIRTIVRRGAVPGSPFSLLFLDPPYRIEQSEVRVLIGDMIEAGWLAEGAVVVWEHDATKPVSWPTSIAPLFDLRYGSTGIDAGTYVRGDAL